MGVVRSFKTFNELSMNRIKSNFTRLAHNVMLMLVAAMSWAIWKEMNIIRYIYILKQENIDVFYSLGGLILFNEWSLLCNNRFEHGKSLV